MPALNDPEYAVYLGVRERLTNAEIAKSTGWSPQYVSALLKQLADKGVIARVGTLPPHSRYSIGYPWSLISDQPPTYKPALPPKAKLKLDYVPTSQRDNTVRPVRLVEWNHWVVQGVPLLRTDGRKPKDALPDRCAVIASLRGIDACWTASSRERWSESRTRQLQLEVAVTPSDLTAMTLVIACAIGVEALLDVATDRGTT